MRKIIATRCVPALVGLLALWAAVHFVPAAYAATGPIPLNCNRGCLEDVVNQYLAALVAHDPKRLPLSADVMCTENDQGMQLGDGFWKTVEGMGNYRHIYADPAFGQVAFMGTMREAGAPMLMSVRLRLNSAGSRRWRASITGRAAAARRGSPTSTSPATNRKTCGSKRSRR